MRDDLFVIELAYMLGRTVKSIHNRRYILRHGLPQRAAQSGQMMPPNRKPVSFRGACYESITAAAKASGVSRDTIRVQALGAVGRSRTTESKAISRSNERRRRSEARIRARKDIALARSSSSPFFDTDWLLKNI